MAPTRDLPSPAVFPLGSVESRASARALVECLDRSATRMTIGCVCHPDAPRSPFTRVSAGVLMRILPCEFSNGRNSSDDV